MFFLHNHVLPAATWPMASQTPNAASRQEPAYPARPQTQGQPSTRTDLATPPSPERASAT